MRLTKDIIRKMIKEAIDSRDHEGDMAKRQMYKTARDASQCFPDITNDSAWR